MAESCENSIDVIEPSELQELLDDENNQPLVVDVRQPREYQQGHIPGSILIPLGQLEFGHPSLDKDKNIVVYCRSGKRSMMGANILCQMGYPRVSSLNKGTMGWKYQFLTGAPRDVLTPGEVSSALDIIAKALDRENRKYHFYWAKYKSEGIKKNAMIKDLLEELAAWEKEHLDAVYQKYVSWSEKHQLPRKSLEEITGPPGNNVDQGLISHDAISDPIELLEVAVEQEYESYNFYKVSAEMIKEEELRRLLLDLAFEERKHASLLLDTISSYLEGDG